MGERFSTSEKAKTILEIIVSIASIVAAVLVGISANNISTAANLMMERQTVLQEQLFRMETKPQFVLDEQGEDEDGEEYIVKISNKNTKNPITLERAFIRYYLGIYFVGNNQQNAFIVNLYINKSGSFTIKPASGEMMLRKSAIDQAYLPPADSISKLVEEKFEAENIEVGYFCTYEIHYKDYFNTRNTVILSKCVGETYEIDDIISPLTPAIDITAGSINSDEQFLALLNDYMVSLEPTVMPGRLSPLPDLSHDLNI